jgi:hypothetical protein
LECSALLRAEVTWGTGIRHLDERLRRLDPAKKRLQYAGASQRRLQQRRSFVSMGRRLRSINLESPADRHSIPNRLPTSVGDHDKLNLDRLFANSRNVGHHCCESVQLKASNQLMREAMGKHQGLGDAARNVGKPLQGTAFFEGHRGLPHQRTIEGNIARTWTTLLQLLRHLNLFQQQEFLVVRAAETTSRNQGTTSNLGATVAAQRTTPDRLTPSG